MSKPPEWITSHLSTYEHENCGDCPVLKALTIAWEALESIDKHQGIIAGDMSKYSVTRNLAYDAMRRIVELGGSPGSEELGAQEKAPPTELRFSGQCRHRIPIGQSCQECGR